MNSSALLCPSLKLFKKGKVREVYDLNDKLLIVATDQISAFDVVLPQNIDGKGELLTKISNYWFHKFERQIKNHLVAIKVEDFPESCQKYREILQGRSVLVWKTELVEVEAIVRGYLSGSGYKDYIATGEISGVKLPEGLQNSAKLEEPIFTPSTKANEGHDQNISEKKVRAIHGNEIIDQMKKKSLYLYVEASAHALKRGIIIADSKFEFGILNDEIILIDEILTPDSSRFWPADLYVPGKTQNSYDKQIARNYLETLDWDKTYPGPNLPKEIQDLTIGKYQEVYDKLTTDCGFCFFF